MEAAQGESEFPRVSIADVDDVAEATQPEAAEATQAEGSEADPAVAGRVPRRVQTLVGPPLLFIHLMKTAGTSFRAMLQDNLGMDAVYPSDADLAQLPNGWYPGPNVILQNLDSIRPHSVLVGHFTAAMLDALPRGYRGITFLREPLQRSLSMLRFTSVVRGVPPEALMERPKFLARSILDYQTRVLSMQDADPKAQFDPVTDATLVSALDRLETLAFVGITERFEESCRLFDQLFGTTVAEMTRRENVGRESSSELSEFIPQLLPLIERDRILYDRAVAILESRLRETRRLAA